MTPHKLIRAEAYGSCSVKDWPSYDRLPRSPSREWRNWVKAAGTKNAPFRVARVPDAQEFPAYFSNTPCGIHRVRTATAGQLDKDTVEVFEDPNGQDGTAFVVEMDKESNLGHALRAGTIMCSYLLWKRLERDNYGHPLTFFTWFETDEGELNEAQRHFKLENLRALGKVVHVTDEMKVKEYKFKKVYHAPWNHDYLEGWWDWSLSQGALQSVFGEASNRLSMSMIVENRRPLKMYTGFSATIRAGLKIQPRHPDGGAVVLIQRGVYGGGVGEKKKRRLLIDAKTESPDVLRQKLCSTGLRVREVDFHPLAKVNTLREQLEIMSGAAVLVGSHGSGLWNGIWMEPGSVVIEVPLRVGYCCMPIPLENRAPDGMPCKDNCTPFLMVNIADGLMASGIKWFYYDAVYIDQPTGDSNRDTAHVHVNGDELANIVQGAHRLATYPESCKVGWQH
eukprot:CAMPEP_0167741452 /NCGR_PEP_ID=MMETSP0110_2-20121227/866_1 /TAXON_ID=629695 /ORGANISM="Gymnochlora sp., Strain CCMP2014" /LENGTH=449 /DNA_ID=CAMNT_0007625509 /DNA_START=330 /DNA_END=1679 /DNA_ORIENTATION=+